LSVDIEHNDAMGGSSAKEAAKEIATMESERAALIEHINPRVIS